MSSIQRLTQAISRTIGQLLHTQPLHAPHIADASEIDAAYLADSVDLADLERRLREVEGRHAPQGVWDGIQLHSGAPH